jgi:hypothetical protein
MRKIIVEAVVALLSLVAFSGISVNFVVANFIWPVYFPKITINSDGSITPQTDYISRNGTVYTLTANLIEQYSVAINCSNIIFDGAGNTINTTNRGNVGLSVGGQTNVTVKNVSAFSRGGSISLYQCSNCLVTAIKTSSQSIQLTDCDNNTITKCNARINLLTSKNNQVLMNNITGLSSQKSFNNSFSQNNILTRYIPLKSPYNSTDHWDNGYLGNYWSDPQTRYFDAKEIGNTGIGNHPYTIDKDNTDNHPLLYPFDIEKGTIAFPTATERQNSELFSTFGAIAIVSVIMVVISVSVFLLFYLKKR